MTTNVNYDLNKALYYLGPKASQKGINYYISNIAITILRVFNYLYEGVWYNNNTARLIVLKYARGRIANDLPVQRKKIERLFTEIKQRPNIDFSDSVTTLLTVNPLLSESRLGKTFCRKLIDEGKLVLPSDYSYTELNAYVLDIEMDMQRPIHLEGPRSHPIPDSAPKMEPKTINEIFERAFNECHDAFWNPKENLSVTEYEEAKKAARLYTSQLMSGAVTGIEEAKGEEAAAIVSNYENALTRKQLCAKALATLIKEKTEIPLLKKELNKIRDISEMLLYIDFSDFNLEALTKYLLQNEEGLLQYIESTMLPVPNPHFKNIKDPHRLLRAAFLDAQKELGAATPTEDKVIHKAIYNLIKQGYVNRSGCHPVLELNEYIHVSTPKPKIFFTADGLETEVYETDLFSSLTNPSDPLKLKEYISTGCSAEQVSAIIDEMVIKIKLRYLAQINETLRGPSTAGDIKGSFKSYIKDLRTPHEIMHHALLFAAHSLTEKQLINAEDILTSGWAYIYICSFATFHILSHAKASTDFNLQLNDHVTIECEKHFVKEYLDDNQLISRELFTSNIFTPDHIEEPLSTDPVHVQAILESFADDNEFIEQYILAKPLLHLYESKYGVNPLRNLQFDFIRRRVENLPTEQRGMIKVLDKEIEAIASHLIGFYKGMCKELCSMVTSPDQIQPVVKETYDAYFISKDIQWEHIDIEDLKEIHSKFLNRIPESIGAKEIEDVFTIRQRSSIQEELPEHLRLTTATLKYANRDRATRSPLMYKQYNSLRNPAVNNSCMYGALAQEIFGEGEINDDNVLDYTDFLRNTASSYIKAHIDDFIETELNDTEREWLRTQRNYDVAIKTLRPVLITRLHTFCDNIEASGDERTMKAIAEVFGIGIDVIDFEFNFQLDSKGVIEPNKCLDPEVFPKALLSFGGKHFTALRRKIV